jgi:Flp pilus assembly protein TadG
MLSFKSRFAADVSGLAMIEFLIVLPLLLLMVFATIQYGMLFITYSGMLNAARDTARQWAVGELASEAAAEAEASARRARSAPWVAAAVWDVSPTAASGRQRTVTIKIPSVWATGVKLPLLPMPETLVASVSMRGE